MKYLLTERYSRFEASLDEKHVTQHTKRTWKKTKTLVFNSFFRSIGIVATICQLINIHIVQSHSGNNDAMTYLKTVTYEMTSGCFKFLSNK